MKVEFLTLAVVFGFLVLGLWLAYDDDNRKR